MHFHLQLCTVAAVVTFWGSSRSGFLPSPNYLNSGPDHFFVILLYTADAHTAFTPSVAIAVLGIVGGEIAAAFLCIHKLRTAGQPFSPHREPALSAVPPLLFSALPLTASRVLLNLFQSLKQFLFLLPCKSME